MRYFLELSYNGKTYHGWQNQPNAISVQQVIEEKLSTLLNTKINIMGAGRTDAGVHAKQMFAHFDYDQDLSTIDIVYKLNSFLPNTIAIANILKVKPEAHTRFDALSRTYHYIIATTKNVFTNDFEYQMCIPLDVDAMNKACEILMLYKDFQCFSKRNTDVKTFNCELKEAFWEQNNNKLTFIITADRFLRNMVRAIVGTLINVGLGKLKPEDLHAIITSKSRSKAGYSVPAHGLYLTKICYPDSIILN